MPVKTTWTDLPLDLRLSIITHLPLSSALSLHSASPTRASRLLLRARIARLKPLRDAWVLASQPALRSYSNPSNLRSVAARRALSPAEFTHLTRLPLGGVCLRSLAAVSELRGLRVLDASRNSLSDVPDEIAACTQLRTLHLGRNRLTAFPDVVLKLPELRTLLLHHNWIRDLPHEWVEVKQLCRLGLFDCDIRGALPEQLCQMLGTQTETRKRRSANLQRNRFDEGAVAGLFRRFPLLASAVVI